MHDDFIAKLDEAVTASGLGDRAKFIRTAILEKAGSLGVIVSADIAAAPSRAGKGGPKKRPKRDLKAPYRQPFRVRDLHPDSVSSSILNQTVNEQPVSARAGRTGKRPLTVAELDAQGHAEDLAEVTGVRLKAAPATKRHMPGASAAKAHED